MGEADDRTRFEAVDWSAVQRRSRLRSAQLLTFLVGGAILLALYLYDTYVAHVYLVADWKMTRIDWVFLAGLVLLVVLFGVPAVRNAETTKRVLSELSSRRVSALAGLSFATFVLAGLVGPLLIGDGSLQHQYAWHPPVGVSIPMAGGECVGAVTRPYDITRYCSGTLEAYPFGANYQGIGMGWLVITGARTALYVAVFTAAFVVPIATVVGVIAGLYGGIVDDLLMGYVDVQLSIPAIILYVVGYMYWGTSLLLLLVTFGLVSWGGIARLVRSEVLQRREAGFVMVARSLGGSPTYLARRHILPNITNTLLPSAFQLIALLILVEVGMAFLGLQQALVYSWGQTIAEGVMPDVAFGGSGRGSPVSRAGRGSQLSPHQYWWIATFPAIAVATTLASCKILGDSLRDALDPRRGHH